MKTILLVEGPIPVRELSGSLFRRRECVLDVASSGSEALDRVRERAPDLVLYDSRVPDLDPASFVESLADEHGSVPVIALLEEHEAERDIKVLEAGASAVLVRPIDEIDLNATIRDVLGIQLRRHLRMFVKIRVDATVGESTHFATIRDLSLSGVRIESERPVRIGDVVKLAFFLPNDDVPVMALCRVVREAGGEPPCHGCEFVGLSVDERQRIHDFLNTVEAGD